jgi:hypothetical protein
MTFEMEQEQPPKTSIQKSTRNYSKRALKVIFALSGNQCAHPDCKEPIIAAATATSDAQVIGQIAHIYASSDGGPRSKAGLTSAERDSPSNLLLLCPTHHAKVDTQFETYPASLLLQWKEKHEAKFSVSVTNAITDIGFAELEVAAKALQNTESKGEPVSLQQIPPKDKIAKNGLGPSVELLLTMGAAKSQECEEVIRKAAQLDAQFPERLRDGFVTKYAALREAGHSGDDLFMRMYDWAGGGDKADRLRDAAGLCMLTHLFILCDVFEK